MKRLVSIFVIFCSVFIGVFAQSDLQTVALVKLSKNEPITLKQLKSRCNAVEFQMGKKLTVEERKTVLEQLINEKLIIQDASRQNIALTDSQMNQYFDNYISQQIGQAITEAQFEKMIQDQMKISLDEYMKKSNGMSVAEYKQFMKSQLIAQQYVLSKKEAEIKATPAPTDKEIRSFYEIQKSSFARPDTMTIFLVIAEKGTTEEASKNADSMIRDMQGKIKKDLKNSSSIETKSKVSGSGYQAGEVYVLKNAASAQQLGITMEGLVELFDRKVGYVSDVTENKSNMQFFAIKEKLPAKILELNDKINPGNDMTVYDYVKAGLLAQAQNTIMEKALSDCIADLRKPENYSIQKSGAALDTLLGW